MRSSRSSRRWRRRRCLGYRMMKFFSGWSRTSKKKWTRWKMRPTRTRVWLDCFRFAMRLVVCKSMYRDYNNSSNSTRILSRRWKVGWPKLRKNWRPRSVVVDSPDRVLYGVPHHAKSVQVRSRIFRFDSEKRALQRLYQRPVVLNLTGFPIAVSIHRVVRGDFQSFTLHGSEPSALFCFFFFQL